MIIHVLLPEHQSITLQPPAEAHVAAGLREWQAKIDETPWYVIMHEKSSRIFLGI